MQLCSELFFLPVGSFLTRDLCACTCRTHAASVLHYTNLLIFCPGGLYAHSIVESLLASAMLLAALCHDYGHPGPPTG